MQLQGYECNRCRTNFEDLMPIDPEGMAKIKCPQCGSSDVEQSETASEFLELIQEMGRTGG